MYFWMTRLLYYQEKCTQPHRHASILIIKTCRIIWLTCRRLMSPGHSSTDDIQRQWAPRRWFSFHRQNSGQKMLRGWLISAIESLPRQRFSWTGLFRHAALMPTLHCSFTPAAPHLLPLHCAGNGYHYCCQPRISRWECRHKKPVPFLSLPTLHYRTLDASFSMLFTISVTLEWSAIHFFTLSSFNFQDIYCGYS